MSLPHALLTALVERPCTGAELVRRFDRSIGYFWQATHQQIYRELGRLEEAGWVESEPVAEGPGRQRAYRVLPPGRKELKRWIGVQDKPATLRDALMVRLRAEAALGPSGLDPGGDQPTGFAEEGDAVGGFVDVDDHVHRLARLEADQFVGLADEGELPRLGVRHGTTGCSGS